MTNTIKLLVAYHKPDIVFKNDFITPIHLGRTLLKNKSDEKSLEAMQFLQSEMIGDDTGDNISYKNSSYNEMTALYWAWKNYSSLGDPDFIGFMHYRRHFYLKKMFSSTAYYECNKIESPSDYIKNVLGLTKENLLDTLKKYDFIVTTPYYKVSVFKHYEESHDINELKTAIEIINNKFPQYSNACQKYIYGHNAYFCNMFVFPKDIFFSYCEFVFGVLEEFEKQIDITNKRLFISERLTGIFIQYLLDKKKKAALVPTIYLEENITIPVVMALDSGFIQPTFTALTSLLENAKPTSIYEIYLLAPKFDYHEISECAKLFNECYPQCTLKVIDMGDAFHNIKMTIGHITSQTYYRLYIPELLPNHKKCLYLDGDIIVNDDLAALFRSNIADFYVGGVRASGYYHPAKWVKTHTEEVGLESINQYINAGVLLMNLDNIRKDKIYEKMLSLVERGFSSQDQDIINLACYGKIRILPLQYNFMTKYVKMSGNKLYVNEADAEVYGKSECSIAINHPTIIHYADKIKPWHNPNVILGYEWLKYYIKSPLVQKRSPYKINIIIPIYNMGTYLSECLDSIFAQTIKDIEVICVNDGSTDNSLEILKQYAKKHKNLFILNQPNKGVAVARNNGLAVANSEFVCFVDPDDFYPTNNVLETLYTKAIEFNVAIAGGSWSELLNDGSIKTEFVGLNDRYEFKKEGLIKYSDYQFDFGFQRFIYSLSLLKQYNIDFPILTRFQDPPFFIKAMLAAKVFYAITMPTYCYRIGHQQPSKWPHKKRNDQLLGIISCLNLSSRNQLHILHNFAYNRLMKDENYFIEEAICGQNNYMFDLLARAYHSIDIPLLSQTIPEINDRFVLRPLKESFGKLQYRKNKLGKEVHGIQSSIEYKIGKIFTFIPGAILKTLRCLKDEGFKYTCVRIFKGQKKAHDYKRRKNEIKYN